MQKYRKPAATFLMMLLLNINSLSMTITLDTSVFMPSMSITIIQRLSIDHLTVFWDTMAILRVDVALCLLWRILGWCPGKIIPADLNVVVCELTELVVIHTEKLSLFGSAQVQAGDLVDDEGEDGGHDEGVACACYDVGDLDVQLLPVVVEPAAGDDTGADTVKANDVVGCKEAVKDETDHSGKAVFGEHVHTVVDADPELD